MFTTKNLLMLVGRHTLIAVGVVGIALVVCLFLAQQITHLSDTVVKNRTLAVLLGSRTELFSLLKQNAAIVGSNDIAINNAFVPSDNILDFIASLESTGLKNSTTQSYRFDSPVAASIAAPFSLQTISYTNTLATNVLTFSNYLKDFERLPYFTKIDSMTISSQDKTGWQGASTATYRATLYTKASQ